MDPQPSSSDTQAAGAQEEFSASTAELAVTAERLLEAVRQFNAPE